MAPVNTAAYLEVEKSPKLVVRSAPYTAAQYKQIVVKSHSLAFNILDWLIQECGSLMYRWLAYPLIMGADVSGEVVELGPDVARFKIGDRILGHAVG